MVPFSGLRSFADRLMLKYLKAFVERMGPVGFGMAISVGCFVMLFVMIGVMGPRTGITLIPAVVVGLTGGAFGFFFVGTLALVVRILVSAFANRSSVPKQSG
jgi:hypothetical protein